MKAIPGAIPKLLNLNQEHSSKNLVFLVKSIWNWNYDNFSYERNPRVNKLWSLDHKLQYNLSHISIGSILNLFYVWYFVYLSGRHFQTDKVIMECLPYLMSHNLLLISGWYHIGTNHLITVVGNWVVCLWFYNKLYYNYSLTISYTTLCI